MPCGQDLPAGQQKRANRQQQRSDKGEEKKQVARCGRSPAEKRQSGGSEQEEQRRFNRAVKKKELERIRNHESLLVPDVNCRDSSEAELQPLNPRDGWRAVWPVSRRCAVGGEYW